MEYRNLGKSELKVSVIGLGGINFGWSADQESTTAIMDKALDIGVNFVDTADSYNKGRSEELVGGATRGKRSRVIIATKFENPTDKSIKGGAEYRSYLATMLDSSLRRLQTDYVDLYQMHWPDRAIPIEETLRALDDLVKAGKVRYIGCSNFAAWKLCQALWKSEAGSFVSFVSVQPQYNLLDRRIEAELVPCCRAYGIGIIPFAPLAKGFLSGKYQKGQPIPPSARIARPGQRYPPTMTDAQWEKLARLEAFAAANGHTVGELALAWLVAKPYVSTVIVGVHQPAQVVANVAAASWKLAPAQVASVDEIA